jgi:hypothetical protein
MAGSGTAGEEAFEVIGGHLGPSGDRAGSADVAGQIAQDAQPGREGDVAEDPSTGAAAAVLFAYLDVVVASLGLSCWWVSGWRG